jgi:hypothetical protein
LISAHWGNGPFGFEPPPASESGQALLRQNFEIEHSQVRDLFIGCDFHSSFQQIAIFDNQTGEIQERKLRHPDDCDLDVQIAELDVLVRRQAEDTSFRKDTS